MWSIVCVCVYVEHSARRETQWIHLARRLESILQSAPQVQLPNWQGGGARTLQHHYLNEIYLFFFF